MVVQCVAEGFLFEPQLEICGVCMSLLRVCGFPPGAPAFDPQKRMLGRGGDRNEPGSV